jgi:hypothetical protein
MIYTSKISLTYEICQIKFARVNGALLCYSNCLAMMLATNSVPVGTAACVVRKLQVKFTYLLEGQIYFALKLSVGCPT